MATDHFTPLLHAYLDSELDLVRSLELEEHLKGCPDCAQELWTQQTLRKAFRSANLYHRAPTGLDARIRAALPQENKVVVMPRRQIWNWLAVAAAIVVALVMTWRMLPSMMGRSHTDFLAQEVVASHIRSLQPGHLLDVESTDQHTVKPWFNGKIDFSPPVNDFTEQGFPLVGGRLDYIDHRPAAALVYQRHKHFINVYVWPEEQQKEAAARLESYEGYNIAFWERGGMYFCAVSDLNSGELLQLVQLLQK
ncbi:MAG: anti-sigma factor family protein [Candidatus Acidiferrales bacterium]